MVSVEPSRPLVDVVIPARNEAANITRCLASVEAQEYRPIRVLLVDGCSGDETVLLARQFAANSTISIEIITNHSRTIPEALNLALRHTNSDYFVRLDAHAEMRQGYISLCVELLSSGEWAGVGGPKIARGTSEFGSAAALAFRNRFLSGGSYYHFGTNERIAEHIPFGAYDTAWVRRIGGWNTELAVNQDYEFDYRLRAAGGLLKFHPSLATDWRGRETAKALSYQYFRYGRGKFKVARMHPSSVKVRQLAPTALVLATATGLSLGLLRRSAPIALVVPVGHLSATLVAAIAGAPEGDRAARTIVLTSLAATIMHWSWGIGLIAGALGSTPKDPFVSNPEPIDMVGR